MTFYRTIQLQDEEHNQMLKEIVLDMLKDAYADMTLPEFDQMFIIVPTHGVIQAGIAHVIGTQNGEEVVAFRMFEITDNGPTYEVRELHPPFLVVEPRPEN